MRPGHRQDSLGTWGGTFSCTVTCFEAVCGRGYWLVKEEVCVCEFLTCPHPRDFMRGTLEAHQDPQWLLGVPPTLWAHRQEVKVLLPFPSP